MGLRSLGNNYQANLGQKKVCSTCVNDPILEKEISQSGTISSCSYCDVHSATWSLKILVNRIEDVYTTLVRPGNYEPRWSSEPGDDRIWHEQEGESPAEILQEMLSCDFEIARDILSVMGAQNAYAIHQDGEEDLYDETSCYQVHLPRSHLHHELWFDFCESIKKKTVSLIRKPLIH